MASVTNQLSSSALKGEHPTVSLNASDAANVLPTLTVGQLCTTSGGNTGHISEIPFGGNIFLVKPITLASRFDSSSTPGVLAAAETLTIV